MSCQGAVQNPEAQARKDFSGENSCLIDGSAIGQCTAEVLRQTKEANAPQYGWAGCDAWFGSAASSTELWSRFRIYSTFFVKNNKKIFPMIALYFTLQDMHGD